MTKAYDLWQPVELNGGLTFRYVKSRFTKKDVLRDKRDMEESGDVWKLSENKKFYFLKLKE